MTAYQLVIDKDVDIATSDGLVLKANVYRPAAPGRYPVVMAHGLYGKDVHFADAFTPQWNRLAELHPDLFTTATSGRYLRWEIVDPERWVPDGYVVIQVDSRGSGKSPGYLEPRSAREIQDYYEAIEWAGTQAWSNGRVGLIGISYYAFTQWAVAALQPPHLAAIVPGRGSSTIIATRCATAAFSATPSPAPGGRARSWKTSTATAGPGIAIATPASRPPGRR